MDWGYNSRLDNIQAAILNIKLKYYPEMLKRRREIGMMYNEGLKGVKDIKLPLQQKDQIYQEYIIRVPDIWKLKDYMENEKDIELLIRDTTPNHLLKGLNLEHFSLPVTEEMATEIVRLPTYPELTNEEVKYVIECVRDFYGEK
jgi:dTDP-4-amino-4,6-dideoxygalactose transaminase